MRSPDPENLSVFNVLSLFRRVNSGYHKTMAVKRYFFTLLILLIPFGACLAGEEGQRVYITHSGAKYHRENCSSLRNSRIPVSLAEAVRSGYEPCSLCNPPSLSGEAAAPVLSELYRVNTAGIALSASADISRMVSAEVVDIVDGDTVRVRIDTPAGELNLVETIRLLGVDTPETVHPSRPVERFGREAGDYTRRTLLGKKVYLAFDWDLRDRYGRLLAYIYTAGGACFNAALVRDGYGHAYVRYAFQFMDEFKTLEREARSARRGLWDGS
jgi:micrococcal nuclease